MTIDLAFLKAAAFLNVANSAFQKEGIRQNRHMACLRPHDGVVQRKVLGQETLCLIGRNGVVLPKDVLGNAYTNGQKDKDVLENHVGCERVAIPSTMPKVVVSGGGAAYLAVTKDKSPVAGGPFVSRNRHTTETLAAVLGNVHYATVNVLRIRGRRPFQKIRSTCRRKRTPFYQRLPRRTTLKFFRRSTTPQSNFDARWRCISHKRSRQKTRRSNTSKRT